MLNLYPPSVFDVYKKNRLRYPPSVDAAVEEIHKACEGIGTDDSTLVKVLGPLSPNDRGLIAQRYQELHNQSLRDLVKSETSGDIGYLLQLITMNLPQAEAYILYHAMKGSGTSDHLLYTVLMGRTNEEIALIKKAFFEMYDTDLSVMVNGEISGDFLAVIMKALQEPMVEYKQTFHTLAKAEEDAKLLYDAGEGKWGTDENAFIKVLLSSPPLHLQHIDAAYKAKQGHGLVEAVENEFSSSDAAALKFFVQLNLDPYNTLAELIESTMAGVGTDETALSAAVVRYHAYIARIKSAYEIKYKTPLSERVASETGGDYQNLLLHIMNAPRSIGDYA